MLQKKIRSGRKFNFRFQISFNRFNTLRKFHRPSSCQALTSVTSVIQAPQFWLKQLSNFPSKKMLNKQVELTYNKKMNQYLFWITIVTSAAQWRQIYDGLFNDEYEEISRWMDFFEPSNIQQTQSTINCSDPFFNVIILNSASPPLFFSQPIQEGWFQILSTIDIYYYSTQNISMQININNETEIHHQLIVREQKVIGFCNKQFYLSQFNYTLRLTQQRWFNVTLRLTSNQDDVAIIRNVHISGERCHSSCQTCSGKLAIECLTCKNSSISQQQGVCEESFIECNHNQIKNRDGRCVNPRLQYYTQPLGHPYLDASRLFSVFNQSSSSPKIQACYQNMLFGFIDGNAGIQRPIYLKQSANQMDENSLGLRLLFHLALQSNSNISFKINNTIIGTVTYDQDKLTASSNAIINFNQALYCQSKTLIRVYGYMNWKSLYSLNLTNLVIMGQASDSYSYWGLIDLQIYEMFCPSWCGACDEFMNCLSCNHPQVALVKGVCRYLYSDYDQCQQDAFYNGTHCIFNRTEHSEIIAKEFVSYAPFEGMNSNFNLIQSQGVLNFYYGEGMYTSYAFKKRIFGGLYVWSNAKFFRSIQVTQPHHSVILSFILYKESGQIISYFINSTEHFMTSSRQLNSCNIWGNSANESVYSVYHEIDSTDIINLTVECRSNRDTPQYFGLSDFCQPFCNRCNQTDCLEYDDTYNGTVKLNQTECDQNQAYDPIKFKCLDCRQQCSSCVTPNYCTSCVTNFTLTFHQCVCLSHQYQEGEYCYDCHVTCETCSSQQNCLSCHQSQNRELSETRCACRQGYYASSSELVCNLCVALASQNNQCPSECEHLVPSCATTSDLESCPFCCQSVCTRCQSGCQECATAGWSLDAEKKICVPTCSDGYVIGDEQCDDANYDQNDGCDSCKFACSQDCLLCSTNKRNCLSCPHGKEPYAFKCQDSYRDQAIGNDLLLYKEFIRMILSKWAQKQIYFLNNLDIIFDGCSRDKNYDHYLCSISKDKLFYATIDGCNKNSGLLYAECLKGEFQCDQNCYYCVQGRCQECSAGFRLEYFNYRCNPICGDLLIVGEEECDDGNLIFEDGCFACQKVCQQFCVVCEENVCLLCSHGYMQNDAGDCIHWSLSIGKMNSVGEICYYDFQNYLYQIQGNICLPQNHDTLLNSLPTECGQGYNISIITGKCEPNNGATQFCLPYNQFLSNPVYYALEFLDDRNCQILTQPPEPIIEVGFSCQVGCKLCYQDVCLACDFGWEIDEFKNCVPVYDDQMIALNEICHAKKYNFQLSPFNSCSQCPENCATCTDSVCQFCNSGFTLDKVVNQCISFCGDGIRTAIEECDDSNADIDDGCLNCRHFCKKECLICLDGDCLACADGWQFNDGVCNSICGDNIVAGLELCDDGNDVPYDGCYECLFQCQLECLVCEKGKCQLCESLKLVPAVGRCLVQSVCDNLLGWYLDEYDNRCKTRCGDRIVAGDEQCEEGVQINGCLECKYQCSPDCLICEVGLCQSCLYGFHSLGPSCKPECGDGIQVPKVENCDDGNQVPRDGCTFCKIDSNSFCSLLPFDKSQCVVCPKNCIECDHSGCKKCIRNHFLGVNGCQACHKKCRECVEKEDNCTECIIENCRICEETRGLYSDYTQGKCVSKCGDSVRSSDEECDDGNYVSLDGCSSQCKEEDDFFCGDKECNKVSNLIGIDYLSTDSTNELYIRGQQQLKNMFTEKLCKLVSAQIEGFEESEFKMNSTYVQATQECIIVLDYYKTIREHNIIYFEVPLVYLTPQAPSLLLQEVKMRKIKITPRPKPFFSQVEIQQAQSVQDGSVQIQNLISVIGPITVLLGGVGIYFKLLDMLTWVNNFYFLNVSFPKNVQQFLQLFQWENVLMLPKFMHFNKEDDEYYFGSPDKFAEKDANPLFINNVESTLFLASALLVVYLICCLIVADYQRRQKQARIRPRPSIFTLKDQPTWQFQNAYSQPSKRISQLGQKINQMFEYKPTIKGGAVYTAIYVRARKLKRNIVSYLFSILFLTSFDIVLGCMLQVTNLQSISFTIVKLNLIAAYAAMAGFCYLLWIGYWLSNQHRQLLANKKVICRFGPFYEDINMSKGLARCFCFINLLKKMLFIIALVLLYNQPFLQTMFCAMISFSTILLMIVENPFNSKAILAQFGVPDCCNFLIVLTTVALAMNDQSSLFSQKSIEMLGFTIIGLISTAIIMQVAFILLEIGQTISVAIRDVTRTIKKALSKGNAQPPPQ